MAEESLAWTRGALELGTASLGTVGNELDAHVVPSKGDAIGDALSIPNFISSYVDDEVAMAAVHGWVLPVEVVPSEGLGLVQTIPAANLLSVTTLVEHYLVLVCLLTARTDNLDEGPDILVNVAVVEFVDPRVCRVDAAGQGGNSGCQKRHDFASGWHVFFRNVIRW